jgi:hypothetical protein
VLKLLETIRYRLALLWYGDAELQERLSTMEAQLSAVRAMSVKNAVDKHRLQEGLGNIAAHAQHLLTAGQGNAPAGVFLPALRDYARELRYGEPGRVRMNTEGVSAAARWGYDFSSEPWVTSRPVPKKVTY